MVFRYAAVELLMKWSPYFKGEKRTVEYNCLQNKCTAISKNIEFLEVSIIALSIEINEKKKRECSKILDFLEWVLPAYYPMNKYRTALIIVGYHHDFCFARLFIKHRN